MLGAASVSTSVVPQPRARTQAAVPRVKPIAFSIFKTHLKLCRSSGRSLHIGEKSICWGPECYENKR